MKSIKKIVFALSLLVLSISFNSCDEVDLLSGSMSCDIDNAAWSAITQVTALKSGTFTILGTSTSGQVLLITVVGTQTGTYSLTSGACLAVYKPDVTDESQNYASKSGTVRLTDVDTNNKTISGTFSFELINTDLTAMSITDGTFTDLPYTNQDE